ncbi:MAG TPA: APC family permease [Acidobacteriaceae bacterium]|jgi:amino acid transporter
MPTHQATTPPHLSRELGQGSALALNMLEMVGVGPFITLPLIVAAMGGPQAMLGWVLGACLALCDGLVWAELAAALPEAGGSYAFLREIYGPGRAGRLVSFLYVWQFTLTAPLVMASGAIGLAQYASYLYPVLLMRLAASGPLQHIQRSSLLAVAVVALVVVLLYRRLRAIKRMAWVLWAGVVLTLGITIVAGFAHFDARQAFSFPAGAFQLNHRFLIGLGAAMLIATYDYWGYYTIAYLAGEVRDPGRTLPRTIIGSILIIAAIYLLMNISVLGVIPWQEFTNNRPSASHTAMVAELLGRSFGPVWAKVGAWLVIWTAFGSLFSLLLGASRVLWAAAVEGNYFRPLARLHPRGGFPANVLLLLGAIACICCFFDLKAIIAALVALRIVLQFLLQQVGVVLLRRRRPDMPRPFRIWLYPLPVILATLGFLFVLASRAHAGREIVAALVVTISGVAMYLWRARRDAAWPFAKAAKETQ